MQEYTSIGFTKKLYGIKGAVRIKIEEPFSDYFLKSEVVFLEIEGRKIPYFIQQVIDAPPLRVIFEEHTDRTKAQSLTGKEIFAPTHLVQPEDPVSIDLTILMGFKIEDSTDGLIGTILEIQEFPQQLMAVVEYREKEILIPLHEDLIENIEQESQTIFVSLPEGLLDL